MHPGILIVIWAVRFPRARPGHSITNVCAWLLDAPRPMLASVACGESKVRVMEHYVTYSHAWTSGQYL